MTATKKTTLAITSRSGIRHTRTTHLAEWESRRLRVVQKRLQALITPGSRCGIPDEHKEAVRLYVETWILPHVETVLGDVKRHSAQDLGDEDRA